MKISLNLFSWALECKLFECERRFIITIIIIPLQESLKFILVINILYTVVYTVLSNVAYYDQRQNPKFIRVIHYFTLFYLIIIS
jgi:hypothetical protein